MILNTRDASKHGSNYPHLVWAGKISNVYMDEAAASNKLSPEQQTLSKRKAKDEHNRRHDQTKHRQPDWTKTTCEDGSFREDGVLARDKHHTTGTDTRADAQLDERGSIQWFLRAFLQLLGSVQKPWRDCWETQWLSVSCCWFVWSWTQAVIIVLRHTPQPNIRSWVTRSGHRLQVQHITPDETNNIYPSTGLHTSMWVHNTSLTHSFCSIKQMISCTWHEHLLL